jgi:hypothetical protein
MIEVKSLITRMPESPSWRSSPPVPPLPFLVAESRAPSEAMVEIAIVRSTSETEFTVSVLALPEPEITISQGGSPASLLVAAVASTASAVCMS